VDAQWAIDGHELSEQNILKICATMMGQVYGAEKHKTTRGKEFQVILDRPPKPATIWSVASWHSSTERSEREIHLVTPADCKKLDKVF
jgi:hypothetical protein